MFSTSPLTYLMRDIGVQLPIAIVYVAGIIAVAMQMQRIPRVSLAAGAGLGVLLLMIFVRPVIFFGINQWIDRGGGPQSAMLIYGIISILFNLIAAAAMAGVIYAIFADRPQATTGKPMI